MSTDRLRPAGSVWIKRGYAQVLMHDKAVIMLMIPRLRGQEIHTGNRDSVELLGDAYHITTQEYICMPTELQRLQA